MERRITVKPGKLHMITLPYSEVCMHMKVAGKNMEVMLSQDGQCAQLFYYKEGSVQPFSFPILASEAGILWDDEKNEYYATYMPDRKP